MRQAIKETLEEAGRIKGVMDYIKAIFTAFGTIGVGALIAFYAPDSLREEIPIHQEVGVGFMIFGTLFALALFCDTGPGSIGQRSKSLLLGVITAVFAVLCAISQMGPHGLGGYALAAMVGFFSIFALWEVITGRPDVTRDP